MKHPPKWLVQHERIHIRQQLEMGIVPFYVWYLVEYGYRRTQKKGHYAAYRAISFEREAYDNHYDMEHLKNRRFWAFLKYL